MLKKVILFAVSLSLFLSIPVSSFAEDYGISAEFAVVIDSNSKTVLFQKKAHLQHAMASTTKIMTALLACESEKLKETVEITDEMLKSVEGTSLYLNKGDRITLYDLTVGALLASGNDAANAIAVFLSGCMDAFLKEMNKKALEIGMKDTVFETPSGLDEGNHHSTAYDMAILSAYAMNNTFFYDICSKKSADIVISGEKQTLYNHNKLLNRSKNFCGVKTGYTEKAGRCLVSAYNFRGSRIICVTLNAPDDWHDHVLLIKHAKEKYAISEQSVQLSVKTVGSDKSEIKCGYYYKLAVIDKIWSREYYYPFVYAPVKTGDVIGYAELYSGNRLIQKVNITAVEEAERYIYGQ